MAFTIRWYLASLAAVSLIAAAAGQSVTPDVRGIYTGTYVCNQRQFGLQLSFEPRSATQLSVVVTFFTPGTDASQPLGAFRADGTFDPASGALRMQPTSWVKPAVTFTMFAFSGTYDAASGRVKGTIQAPGCMGFDAARDEQASRRLAAAAVAREAEFANAPTSFAAARNPGEQCLVIGKWYSRFTKEHPTIDILRSMADELSRNAMNLFMDEEFLPVFGKTFDKMTDAERRPIALTIRTCASQLTDRGDLFMYQNPLQRPFSAAAAAADVVSQLAYRRTLRQQRQQLLKELPSLPGTDVSLDRVTALRDSELKNFAILWPSEHRELTDALDAAATRIASPVLERWVDGVVSGASGYQGLTAVMTAQSRLAAPRPKPASAGMPGRGAPAPSRAPASSAPASGPSDAYLAMISDAARLRSAEKLQAKADALVRELAAAEKSKLAGLGTGLAALQAGTAWYGQVMTSFASFSNHPAVQDAMSAFEARRAKDLASGIDGVLAKVNQAQTAAQVRAVTATYLGVPSDRSHEGAMRILAAAGAREQKLGAAAARAEEEARSATNLCKPLSSTDVEAGTRAPSSRDLCLAIANQFDALNDTVRSRAAACRSGGNLKNDPVLALQCIGLCAGAANCEFAMSLTRFERIACEKAQGVPGFVCTYIIGMSHSDATMAQVFASIGASGAVTEARFVQTPNGWIKLQR
jgi:hypothetical protein